MGTGLKSVKDVVNGIMEAWDQQVRISVLQMERDIATALQEREDDRQSAYHERNRLVALLSKLYPAHLTEHPADDQDWDDEWRTIVCVHTPAGQVTWHLHDDEIALFRHLVLQENDWDGHTTEEKYARLEQLP